jgi:CHASE1-domain containing sensor protein
LPVAAVLLVGILSSLGAYLATQAWDELQRNEAFHLEAKAHVEQFADRLRRVVAQVQAVGQLYSAADDVTEQEFSAFLRPFLTQDRLLHSLYWAPRILDEGRDAFEAHARAAGQTDFTIRDWAAGALRPAERRPEYFPVDLVEPRAGHEPILGFDLGSEPLRRAALEQARDLGQPQATAQIHLIQATGHRADLLVILPHFQSGAPAETPEERRRSLLGFVLGVVRIADLMTSARAYLPVAGFDLLLRDTEVPGAAGLFGWYPSRGQQDAAPGPPPAHLEPGTLQQDRKSVV